MPAQFTQSLHEENSDEKSSYLISLILRVLIDQYDNKFVYQVIFINFTWDCDFYYALKLINNLCANLGNTKTLSYLYVTFNLLHLYNIIQVTKYGNKKLKKNYYLHTFQTGNASRGDSEAKTDSFHGPCLRLAQCCTLSTTGLLRARLGGPHITTGLS